MSRFLSAEKMPSFRSWSVASSPIVLNRNYIRSATGLLKCTQCLLGFTSFLCIWFACRSNYDPYLGTSSGFVGGDIETLVLLVHFSHLFMSLLLITTYYFSIIASTIISKTVFEFVYNVVAVTLLLLTSLTLLVTVANRNQHLDGFPPEPGFAGKVAASILGLLNGLLYGADTVFAYRAYIQS